MRFSKPKQFWAWFQRNKESYEQLRTASSAETIYHMREMTMHLNAYGRYINAEIYWQSDKGREATVLVFTTYARPRDFRKVGRLVACAPQIPGWRFLELDPPRPIDFFLEEDYGHLNFDPFNLWFLPPDPVTALDKYNLDLYIDNYADLTPDHENAARAVVYNLLGEKVYGLKLRRIDLARVCDLPKEYRGDLVNLQQIPEYVQLQDTADYYIDQTGNLKKYRPNT
ncbi:hypothetical protein D3H65_30690 [Paraflavitalea soli]|uniref:Uncharacterized protein n=1 Tax=Paraflavitalea soli TaxID=2315862 RepID=A0A3B7N207_9BACT|nr:hypothetical protein [Paraflavitalea soli]AXY78095.1 hypothetical protein D3H65_30690 [Paraflavitalea soli]